MLSRDCSKPGANRELYNAAQVRSDAKNRVLLRFFPALGAGQQANKLSARTKSPRGRSPRNCEREWFNPLSLMTQIQSRPPSAGFFLHGSLRTGTIPRLGAISA
jgi:hypothetical protein